MPEHKNWEKIEISNIQNVGGKVQRNHSYLILTLIEQESAHFNTKQRK